MLTEKEEKTVRREKLENALWKEGVTTRGFLKSHYSLTEREKNLMCERKQEFAEKFWHPKVHQEGGTLILFCKYNESKVRQKKERN